MHPHDADPWADWPYHLARGCNAGGPAIPRDPPAWLAPALWALAWLASVAVVVALLEAAT